MDKIKEFLKDKGVKLVEKTNQAVKNTKEKIKNTILNDQLRRRFQLENPHKFVVSEKEVQLNLIQELTAEHAKVYDEDDVFVFYGHNREDLQVGYYIKNLKDLQTYRITDLAEVELPVTHQDKIYDVEATAVYCEEV